MKRRALLLGLLAGATTPYTQLAARGLLPFVLPPPRLAEEPLSHAQLIEYFQSLPKGHTQASVRIWCFPKNGPRAFKPTRICFLGSDESTPKLELCK